MLGADRSHISGDEGFGETELSIHHLHLSLLSTQTRVEDAAALPLFYKSLSCVGTGQEYDVKILLVDSSSVFHSPVQSRVSAAQPGPGLLPAQLVYCFLTSRPNSNQVWLGRHTSSPLSPGPSAQPSARLLHMSRVRVRVRPPWTPGETTGPKSPTWRPGGVQ